jgi:hypothetical protein
MRRLAIVLASVGACVVLSAIGASAQTAPSVVATGWWSRSPLASAPEGGLAVGAAPDGATSVSAIKVDLGGGVTNAVIALDEVSATGADLGAIVACAARNDWEPVEKGELTAAPRTDCSASPSVPVTRDASTLQWSVDLTRLLEGRTGEVTIALIPSWLPQTATAGGVAAFDVQWSGPPTLTATAAVTSASTPVTTATTRAPAPAVAAAPTRAPATVTFNVTPAAVPAPDLVAQGEATTTTAPEATPPTTASSFATSGLAGSAEGGDSSPPIAQAIFFIVVSGIAGTIGGVGRWFATRR